MVGRGDTQEVVAVLCGVHRVREVVVGEGEAAVEDFAAHEVVLHVALAEAPGERAVVVLTEAHEDAGRIDAFGIPNGAGVEVPTDFAGRVDDGRDRNEVPGERPAHGVVPDGAVVEADFRTHVVDEVETVFEGLVHLLDSRLEEARALELRALIDAHDRARVDRIGFSLRFVLAVEVAHVGDFHRVAVVGVKTEDGNACVREELAAGDVVLDFTAALLRDDAHRGALEVVAAVLDDGGERRHLVGIDDNFAEFALDRTVLDDGAADSAHGVDGAAREGGAGQCGQDGRGKKILVHEMLRRLSERETREVWRSGFIFYCKLFALIRRRS